MFNNASEPIELRTIAFEVKSPTLEWQLSTRADAIDCLESQGFTVQEGSNVTVEQYYDQARPELENFVYVGWSNLLSYARSYNTTVIYEYIADRVVATETHHYDIRETFFYVEQPNTPFKLSFGPTMVPNG